MKKTARPRIKTLLLTVPFLIFGLVFSLITGQIFSEEAIKTELRHFAAAHNSVLTFNPNISRHLFPYPSITLHQVSLQPQNNTQQADFQAQTVHIQLGWSQLWGQQHIHAIKLDNAHIIIRENTPNSTDANQHHPNGDWQLGGIPLHSAQNNPWQISNIEWQNSRIQLHSPHQQLQLHQSQGNFNRDDGTFALQAQADTHGLSQLALHGQYSQNQFHALEVQTLFSLTDGSTIQLHWQGQAQYHPDQHRLTGQSGQLKLTIPKLEFNLEAHTQNWHISSQASHIAEIPFTFTAHYGGLYHNGSGNVRRLHYHKGHWHLPSLNAETATQHGGSETLFTLDGSFNRHPDGLFVLEPLNIQTRLQVAAEPAPMLQSQWQGHLKGNTLQTWQTQLTGILDAHPAKLNLQSQSQEGQIQVQAELQAGRLNLTPYLKHSGGQGIADNWVSGWRQLIGRRQLTLGLNIDTLDFYGVQIKQLQTRIQAQADGAQSEQLHMSLYGGQAQGQVGLHNRPQNGWFARLDFKDIHIKPLLQDLFRFNHLSGKGDAQIHLTSQGLTPQQWRATLNGHSEIRLNSGAWQGINLSNIVHGNPSNKQNQFAYDDDSQTRFNHFYAISHFSEGRGYTTELRLNNPQLHLQGQGDFDIPSGTLNYALLLNRTPDKTWLPLKIGGRIQRPDFALDYSRMTRSLDSNQAKQALQDILNQQWSWIQKLPEARGQTEP